MGDLLDQSGWLYICMDIKNPDECKIGMTTRPLYERITETGNPDYLIVKAYKVPLEEARKLERHIQNEVFKSAKRKFHIITGKPSEWFLCSPQEAAQALEHDLAKCLCLQDENGNPNLSGIVFKPVIDWGNQMTLLERVGSKEHFNNAIQAINEA